MVIVRRAPRAGRHGRRGNRVPDHPGRYL